MAVPPEMLQALYNAGFRGAALQRMAAIGMRESGGNPSAHNGNAATGDDSWGWFQINYLGNLKASRTAQFGAPQQLIASPQAQANAAWALSNGGTNFQPWTTNKGLPQAFLDDAQSGINQLTASGQIAVAPAGYSGGGGVATASNPGAAAAPVPFNPANVDAIIRQSYGYEAWALDVPELHTALVKALSDHGTALDQATLEGYIKATDWWKTNSTSQRNFAQLQGEDPAEAQAQITKSLATVTALATQYGLNLDPARAKAIATNAVQFGWDTNMLNAALGNEAATNAAAAPPGAAGTPFSAGTLADSYAKVQNLARNYYVNIDPATARDMAIKLTDGQLTDAAMQGTMVQQALAKYAGDPTTTAGINAGFTVKQLATDQLNSMAKLLGVSADAIDLSSPQWSPILNYRDPTSGTTRIMNTGETENLVRQSDQWDHTSDANSTTATALKAFTADMGKAKF